MPVAGAASAVKFISHGAAGTPGASLSRSLRVGFMIQATISLSAAKVSTI